MPIKPPDYRYWQCATCNRVVRISVQFGVRDRGGAFIFPLVKGERRKCVKLGCSVCGTDRLHIPLVNQSKEILQKKINLFGLDEKFRTS